MAHHASGTSSSSWLKPFFAGAVTALTTFYITPYMFSSLSSTTIKNDSSEASPDKQKVKPSASSSASSLSGTDKKDGTTALMDSPTLDQRILRKAEAALLNRTSRLIIVVERCTNDHNYSAILRTAEALGVQHVWIIAPQAMQKTLKNEGGEVVSDDGDNNDGSVAAAGGGGGKLHRSTGQPVKKATESEIKDRAQHHLFAQRAQEWLDVREFDTTKECIDALRKDEYQIWSTDLSQEAVCLTREGLSSSSYSDDNDTNTTNNDKKIIPDKLAIVFGTEAVGCTTEILTASDKRVYLPLRGFADSLNLSVATALCVHQLFILDPTLAGAMSKEEQMALRKKWYTKLASQRLVSKSQKAARSRLVRQIRICEEVELSRKNDPNKNMFPLKEEQKAKIDKLPSLRQQLQELDDELKHKSEKVVEDLVSNPPEPLGDMRRADEHRTSYVGKKTKKKHGEVWGDMPATAYYKTENESSAAFFRDLLDKKE